MPKSEQEMRADVQGPRGSLNLGDLGLDRGAHLIIKRALREIPVGDTLEITGRDPSLAVQLRAWCRAQGHGFEASPVTGAPVSPSAAVVRRGGAESWRWRNAELTGHHDPAHPDAVASHPSGTWGVAMRGARVEAGVADFQFPIADKDQVWSDDAARIYAQAVAAQWNPETAIDWQASFELPAAIEDAVVQVMTYLVENEMAALIVPARFLGRIHPHFREVMQVLAVQVADEARHIEVFSRRAQLQGETVGVSTVGSQSSLKTLLDEPDFALASFLLSVLGEGTFLSLLHFIDEHAPDPITRQVARLAYQDEARHVAFGLSHLKRHVALDPGLRGRLALAVERRHAELQNTAGLNEEVFDALLLLAAGSWEPSAIGAGFDRIAALERDMDAQRRRRLATLGFTAGEAEALSALHTRNFM